MLTRDKLAIVRAEEVDCPTLTAISKAAKAHWGYPQEWLDLWEAVLTITPTLMKEGFIYKLVDDQEILGFCMLLDEGDKLEIEHLWIRPKYMGQGLGSCLLQGALDRVIRKSHVTLSVVADPNVTGFYEKFGLVTVDYLPSQPAGRELPLMQRSLGS